ncbi:UNVERIFIED_CONTAM: hypothetical protein K2H54_024840 [Gekko kuhli]
MGNNKGNSSGIPMKEKKASSAGIIYYVPVWHVVLAEEIPLLPPRGTRIGTAASDEEFKAVKEMRSNEWAFLVPMSELKSENLDTDHNYFCVTSEQKWTHIRLNIYPDGGIARLKVYGTISRDWSLSGQNDLSDLVAMANGGICVGYSDAQLGHPHNILGIGRAKSIKDGWETRRSLERPPVLKADDKGDLLIPGREWAVFRLGHPGIVTHIEIDTSQFKGNFPDTCTLEACILSVQQEKDCIAQKWSLKQGTKWNVLLPVTKLKPHKRHFFDATATQTMNICTHVRLTIAPDGGLREKRQEKPSGDAGDSWFGEAAKGYTQTLRVKERTDFAGGRGQGRLNAADAKAVQSLAAALFFQLSPSSQGTSERGHGGAFYPPTSSGVFNMVAAARSRTVYSLTDATPARTIWVYRNGDPFFLGKKFVINHRYVPTFEAFMIQLNESVQTPFGVRNVYTPQGGHSVNDLTDLHSGGKYVAAGREKFRKLK